MYTFAKDDLGVIFSVLNFLNSYSIKSTMVDMYLSNGPSPLLVIHLEKLNLILMMLVDLCLISYHTWFLTSHPHEITTSWICYYNSGSQKLTFNVWSIVMLRTWIFQLAAASFVILSFDIGCIIKILELQLPSIKVRCFYTLIYPYTHLYTHVGWGEGWGYN